MVRNPPQVLRVDRASILEVVLSEGIKASHHMRDLPNWLYMENWYRGFTKAYCMNIKNYVQ